MVVRGAAEDVRVVRTELDGEQAELIPLRLEVQSLVKLVIPTPQPGTSRSRSVNSSS